MPEVTYSDRVVFQRLLSQGRRYWPNIAAILLVDLLAVPLALLTPLPLKIAVDSVIGSSPLPWFLGALLPEAAALSKTAILFVAAGLQIAVVLLMQLQSTGNYVLRTKTGEGLVLDFRARLFRHVQRLSLLFHDQKGTSDSIYRILYDAPSIQWITIWGVIPFIAAGFTLLSMIVVIASIEWQLALVALTVSPILLLLSRAYRMRMPPRYTNLKKIESHALTVVQEVLTTLRVVKAFCREENEQARFVRHSNDGMRARINLAFAEGIFGLLVNMTTALGTAIVLFVGVRSVQSGGMTLGELLMVISYLSQLYSPLQTISKQIAGMQSSLASARRAFELLDEVPEVPEQPQSRSIKRAAGKIEFRDVSFGYGEKPVLRNVSFKIAPGTHLGIAGRTGAGKSTLVSLLMRFYDPREGQVLLDDVDIRGYKLVDLRNQFSIVLQDPVLFSTSIGENIAYGRPGASEEEIIEAAKAANAHQFIMKLSEGYQTQVGERGVRLSGGERQRIALARAFLKDAPILILDEPTSSIDTKTESAIMDAMDRLMEGRTTVMIAHRLSTLENCDMLLVIEDGQPLVVTSDVSGAIRDVLMVGGTDATIVGAKA